MAHSTRKKLKTARGGKTRNQEFKAQRQNLQAERLRTVQRAEEERLLNLGKVKETVKEAKKTVKPNMSGHTVKRRSNALARLSNQLIVGLKNLPSKRIVQIPQQEYLELIKGSDSHEIVMALTPADRQRIEKEIATLKLRGATLPKTQPIS